MPSVLLSVPHFEQSRDGVCLPACVRMVLAFWKKNLPEADIAQTLGTKEFGCGFYGTIFHEPSNGLR
jgi:hypothetical protein